MTQAPEQRRLYRLKNKDKIHEYAKEWRNKNKLRISEKNREWHIKNSDRFKERMKKNWNNRLNAWIGLIPKITNCELCGKEIYLNANDIQKSIHFDHRNNGDEEIKMNPTAWLGMHRRTKEREEIWKRCNFGMLCNTCNKMLPTQDRVEYLLKALRYTIIGRVK